MKKRYLFLLITIVVIALSCALCFAACDDSEEGCKHVMETIDEVEATCVKDGNIEYYHCSVCDKYFLDEQGVFPVDDLSETVTTDPDNHDYDTVIESADCENNGVKKLVCRRNSAHMYVLETYLASGHSVVTGGKCEVCDKQIATAGLEYTLSEDGEKYFVSSGSASGKITIPGKYNGKTVIISENSFTGNANIEEVTVLQGVQKIYENAFNNCVNLAVLNLPKSIDYISDGAFTGCNALVSINVDEDNFQFAGVDGSLIDKQYNSLIFGARDGVIPGGYELRRIESYAFEGSAIQSIVIPAGIETINRSAFKDCADLTRVTISSDVQLMADRAFYGCSAIKGVYIDDIAAWCNIEFQSEANPLENNCPLFVNNQPLTKFTSSEDINAINDYAFSGCTSITEVSLGRSVKSIGDSAFAKCINLTYVGCSDSLESIGRSAFSGCISLEEAGLSDLIEVIPMYCFDGCISLSSVHIPSSLKEIGYNAFADCAITDVRLPDGVINIDRYAFIRNRALQSVYVPDSVISISYFTACDSAVLYCEAPEQPSSWGSSWVCALPIVWNCKTYGETEDGFKWGLTNSDEMVISGYTGDSKKLVVPDTVEDIEVTQIAFRAFYDCNDITSISLPFIGGVKDGDINTNFGYIFGAKDSTYNSGYVSATLTEVIITGSSKIGELAFQSCSHLTKLVIPATVTEIGSRLVLYCNKINIYCEVESKPDGWHDAWNAYNAPVVWGYTGE